MKMKTRRQSSANAQKQGFDRYDIDSYANDGIQEAFVTFDSYAGPTIPDEFEDGAVFFDGPGRPYSPHTGPKEDIQNVGDKDLSRGNDSPMGSFRDSKVKHGHNQGSAKPGPGSSRAVSNQASGGSGRSVQKVGNKGYGV